MKLGLSVLIFSVLSASARILNPEYTVLKDVSYWNRPPPRSNLDLNSNKYPTDNNLQVCSYGRCSENNKEDHHGNYILKHDVGKGNVLSPERRGDWSYKGSTGAEFWSGNYPLCGGLSQSPIDIHLNDNINGENLALKLDRYDLHLPGSLLHGKKNMDFIFDEEPVHIQPSVYGGYIPNNDSYEFAGIHFHWGKNNSFGSEHLINGRSYPAEAHFVHFNKKNVTLSEAADKPDGLLVLGFFLKISDISTPGLHHMAEGMKALEFGEDAKAAHLIGEVSLHEFLGYGSDPKYVNQYVFYKGSLTTPPCNENVLWHVFPKAIPIKQEDLLHFRRMRSFEEGFPAYSNNFRPVQPINGRKVLWNNQN